MGAGGRRSRGRGRHGGAGAGAGRWGRRPRGRAGRAGLGAGSGRVGADGRHDVRRRKRARAPTTYNNCFGDPSGSGLDVPTGSSRRTRQKIKVKEIQQ